MTDRTTGAARLKALRKSRGLSLAETARALLAVAERSGRTLLPSVAGLQRSVARWEAPSPVRPDERHQLLLAHLYARTPTGALSLGAGSDFAELLDALANLGESEDQLARLRTLVLRSATERGGGLLMLLSPAAQVGIAAALADPRRLDADALRALETLVADVNAAIGSVPFVRLQLLLAPGCRRLPSAAHRPCAG